MLRSAEPDEIWISTVARLPGITTKAVARVTTILLRSYTCTCFATCGLRRLKHYGGYRRTHGAGTAEASAMIPMILVKMVGCVGSEKPSNIVAQQDCVS